MKLSPKTWLVLSMSLACGDDESSPKTPCAQLQNTLCTRTAECAEEAGLSTPAQHDAFFKDCLDSDLQCREPLVGGDFELCEASLATLPCDYVVEQLREDKLVSSSNCEEYLAL